MSEIRFLPAGDTAVVAEFGNEISESINRRVHAFAEALNAAPIPGIRELVPTYRSLMIHYDPRVIRYQPLLDALSALSAENDASAGGGISREVLVIPVLYGGEAGPDISNVAEKNGLTEEEVIALHSAPDYRIYMLGFTPGFTYLGGMDPRLETPRLTTPREKIPAGSVGIAGMQTGVYPIDSPGGWQLIGRTPVRFYDPDRAEPILPRAGLYIRFRPVSKEDYLLIQKAAEAGTYQVEHISVAEPVILSEAKDPSSQELLRMTTEKEARQ
ncbi:MAG: 5-oxoprolinase subunit PxpB [Lachnospiraceae bacterium]|nr:5-oxoprolinase subunit PxpB [Lachnospiraceae bacterium]